MNVLFVSNSTCNYFRDELYGMLEAVGYRDINLCLTYYSGCKIHQHYAWHGRCSHRRCLGKGA